MDPTGLGPISFGACSVANGIMQTYDFMSGVQSLLESTKMTRELLDHVNKEIASCPTSNTERLGELNSIKNSLSSQLARSTQTSVNNITKLGVGEAAQGLMWEAGCAAAGLAPFLP
jgi:transketolase N-terminal domain/subunit